MNSFSQPLVTVIVPIFKVEAYIRRCVDSILNQSCSDLEIVLVDDGSPDHCAEICDEYRLRDQRIRVIHQKNGGLSSARNAGLRLASGEFICFVDGDDYILPDMIEQLFQTMKQTRTRLAVCGITSEEKELSTGISDKSKVFSSADALREILTDGAFTTSACAKLFDRSLFDGICFPDGRIYEDYGTVYKLFHAAGMVAYVDTPKYFYTTNASGITKGGFSPSQMDYFALSGELERFLEKNYPQLTRLARSRSADMAVSLFRRLSASPERERFASEREELVRIIRKGLHGFFLSSYPMRKKLSALAVSAAPGMTEKLFAAVFSRAV